MIIELFPQMPIVLNFVNLKTIMIIIAYQFSQCWISRDPLLTTSFKRGFKLASLNVNKLSTHIDEIRILLVDKCLDVLAIQETKVDMSNNNSDFYICGYELIRRDRLSDAGGGICFYIYQINIKVLCAH